MNVIDWILDRPLVAFGAMIILFAVIVTVECYAQAEAAKECHERGGQWVKTGESTVWIHSGNMTYPVTSDTYGCR